MCHFVRERVIQVKRALAVLLALSVFACCFAFHAAAEDILCDITVEISGGGCATDGVDTTYSLMKKQYVRGEEVTLTASPELNPDGSTDYAFLYWKNKETDRILSYEPEYTFFVATYMTFEAVFDFNDETAAEYGVHRVVYLSEGGNVLYTESVDVGDDTYINNVIPEPRLYISGRTWLGWDHTPQQVAADPKTVYVRPRYSNDTSYVISSVVNGVTSTQQVKYGNTATITCPYTLNGKNFSYWVERGEDVYHPDQIASYFVSYSFIAVCDVTLEAVYGDGAASGVSIRIVGDTPDFENSKIQFSAERSVTRGYTVLQTGIILTKNVRIGGNPNTFVINANEPDILKGTSNSTASSGTYNITLRNWYATTGDGQTYYPLVYARGYVVVRNSSGGTETFYSNIYCADYINRVFIGVIEGDNFPDPF